MTECVKPQWRFTTDSMAMTRDNPNLKQVINERLTRPPSLVAMVTDRLRRSIIDGEYRLGESVSEDKLASAFGVSRTPVREALTALQLQGLINIQPQRGSFVFLPSEEEVHALCEFRMIMEGRAMALSLARNKDRTLAQLREANTLMEDAIARNDPLALTHGDTDLHNALFDNCGNQYLAQAYALMSGRIATLRTHLSSQQQTVGRNSIEEHRDILEAFSAGDLGRAENLLSVHIFRMRERYTQALAAKTLP
ncbi:MAG: GntR family transcriptional regulator [Polaromonas sp.]|jgi:DNA-binding GntR family transcriptional regulator|nr:GntR family transcriptional regulator [Polaromonas sp.]